jgi:hypothetical protein
MEAIGSVMILIGLIGVINCGDSQVVSEPTGTSKLLGDPSRPPTEIFFNVIKMS